MKKLGSEIVAGDCIKGLWFWKGDNIVVKSVIPYTGILLEDLGKGTQIASFMGTNTKMTLEANAVFNLETIP